MTILSILKEDFKRLKGKILYGPDTIPKWHPLYGKKYYRCGVYRRELILYNKVVITVVVHRFYSPEEKKTYSLLPFFITRYQRHINTIIDDVIRGYFLEGRSIEELSDHPSPGTHTVKRWIKKFKGRLDSTIEKVEKYLIKKYPDYLPVRMYKSDLSGKVMYLLEKVNIIEKNKSDILLFGSISFINYIHAVQAASL
jgi:hypothetical protein